MSNINDILFFPKQQTGLFSVCTANELVIKAAIVHAKKHNYTVAIEATANQVNQFGGYTGMTPNDYAKFVQDIAAQESLPQEQLILGGDHLGPLTWSSFCETEAMNNSAELIRAYVNAGFSKIHIDTSMRLFDDDPNVALNVEICAARGAKLARVVFEAYDQLVKVIPNAKKPSLIIGSEVPIPGGSQEHEDFVAPTSAEEFERQLKSFKRAYENERVPFDSVIAFVVQPGVEFGDDFVYQYNPLNAMPLIQAIKSHASLVFEGHSTDYQTRKSLCSLVQDKVAILKVGPGLTFALREALFLLEEIEKIVCEHSCLSNFKQTVVNEMTLNSSYWKNYYLGTKRQIDYKMLYSYSDRFRYYLPTNSIQKSILQLMTNLNDIPVALLSQFFPRQYTKVMCNELTPQSYSVVLDRIGDVLDDYAFACGIKLD